MRLAGCNVMLRCLSRENVQAHSEKSSDTLYVVYNSLLLIQRKPKSKQKHVSDCVAIARSIPKSTSLHDRRRRGRRCPRDKLFLYFRPKADAAVRIGPS